MGFVCLWSWRAASPPSVCLTHLTSKPKKPPPLPQVQLPSSPDPPSFPDPPAWHTPQGQGQGGGASGLAHRRAHTPLTVLLSRPFLISASAAASCPLYSFSLFSSFPPAWVSVSGFLHLGYCGGPASVFVSHPLPSLPTSPSLLLPPASFSPCLSPSSLPPACPPPPADMALAPSVHQLVKHSPASLAPGGADGGAGGLLS